MVTFNSSEWGLPAAAAFQGSGFYAYLPVCFTKERERLINPRGRPSEGLSGTRVLLVPTPANESLPSTDFGAPLAVPSAGTALDSILYPEPPQEEKEAKHFRKVSIQNGN